MQRLLVVSLCVLFAIGCRKLAYSGGKDTAEAFGVGRYQMLYHPGSWLPQRDRRYTLYDVVEQKTIFADVRDWASDAGVVYAITDDERPYCTFDIGTGERRSYRSADDAPEGYRKALGRFEKSAMPVRAVHTTDWTFVTPGPLPAKASPRLKSGG